MPRPAPTIRPSAGLALALGLALCGCAALPGPALQRERARVVGGFDAPGDGDHIYVQHATPDGRRFTLTALVLPDDWRARTRTREGVDFWGLAEPAALRPVPLEHLDPYPQPDEEALGMPDDWARWGAEPPLGVLVPPPDLSMADGARWASVAAHLYRRTGHDVFLVEHREDGARVALEVYGAQGYPIEWIHIGSWQAELPALAGIEPEVEPDPRAWIEHPVSMLLDSLFPIR